MKSCEADANSPELTGVLRQTKSQQDRAMPKIDKTRFDWAGPAIKMARFERAEKRIKKRREKCSTYRDVDMDLVVAGDSGHRRRIRSWLEQSSRSRRLADT